MNVTLEQSIAIYARMSRKRFGAKARHKTQNHIEHLLRVGDLEGARVHEQVKQQIMQLERQNPSSLEGV